MSLPGSSPVSRICTHFPTPYFMRQSFRMAASSLVQPGDGVKFHLSHDQLLLRLSAKLLVASLLQYHSRSKHHCINSKQDG